ncbi:MAG: Holliday junction resolvase RuvX [Actinomycetota bacterium]
MILGIDFGSRRVGVAVADGAMRFARPLEVVDAHTTDPLARIVQLVDEMEVSLVVVGRPVSLSGRSGPAVEAQSAFTAALRQKLEVEVVEHDERLTTVVAEQGMRAAGAGRVARRERRDAVAAQMLLQGYLDAGRP